MIVYAYELLESIGGITSVEPRGYEYFTLAYKYALSITVALAVIMIVIGGVQYTISWASPSAKGDAKNRILSAIGGLVLALASYLILQTINPALVRPSISLPPPSPDIGGGGGGGGANCGGRGRCGGPTAITDDEARAKLRSAGVGGFNLADCEANGFASPCGYFQGIKEGIISYTAQMEKRCGCQLVARDATGPGHDTDAGHYSGEKIDFAPSSSLNGYIRNQPDQFKKVGKSNGWDVYQDTSPPYAKWVFEEYPDKPGKDHWDVDTTP
ncbi:MAG TPA: pilin [Candidatus Paceibacterota bacterium]